MTNHGTAPYTEGQLAEFIGEGTRALALIASRLGFERMGYWSDKRSEEMQKVLLAALAPNGDVSESKTPAPKLPHYADGVVFEMTLDGDASENHPLEMVRKDGYTGAWKHNGSKVKGRQTRRFKWVAVGYQSNLEALCAALAPHGKIPEGQWREAVKQMFEPDREHPRGIADPSWEYPDGRVLFPYVDRDGLSDFHWASRDRDGRWRWLVEEVSK